MASYNKVYWRASGVPTWGLVFLIIASALAYLAAEGLQQRDPVAQANYTTMLTAATEMRESMAVIKERRAAIEPINPVVDPQRSGWVGLAASEVTTTRGGRESKLTSINPNWAAVAVKLLAEAGVEEGDLVAVTVSGSFPALNLAVYHAIEAMGAEAVVIASASSSQWGANVPDLLWLDMEQLLRANDRFAIKPILASLGGIGDNATGLDEAGANTLTQAIREANIELLLPNSYQEAVATRIARFREASKDRPIKAFVNVGGGATIVGPPGIDDLFGNGLVTSAPGRAYAVPTVMGYFLEEGIPAIQFINVKDLAQRYGLPLAPEVEVPVGNGGIYTASTYRRWLAAILGLALFGLTWMVVRSARFTSVWRRGGKDHGGVRPMV